MPKFHVHLQQFVEEVATVIVEAETPEEAARRVQRQLRAGDLDPMWSDGDDSRPADVYAVSEPSGVTVWER